MSNEEKAKVEEIIEITEEDIENSSSGKTWSEEIEMAGKDVLNFLKGIWNEATIRRIIIRDENGETLLNLPVAVGAFGILFPYVLVASAVGVLLALATRCTVTIERIVVEEEAEVSA